MKVETRFERFVDAISFVRTLECENRETRGDSKQVVCSGIRNTFDEKVAIKKIPRGSPIHHDRPPRENVQRKIVREMNRDR